MDNLSPTERGQYAHGRSVGYFEGFMVGSMVGGFAALALCAIRAAYTTGLCG